MIIPCIGYGTRFVDTRTTCPSDTGAAFTLRGKQQSVTFHPTTDGRVRVGRKLMPLAAARQYYRDLLSVGYVKVA